MEQAVSLQFFRAPYITGSCSMLKQRLIYVFDTVQTAEQLIIATGLSITCHIQQD